MFTRAELEYKNRVCMAQMKLRVVVFSMVVALPVWLLITLLRKLGFTLNAGVPERAVGCGLLLIYAVGVFAIFRRTQLDHEMTCPHCKAMFGPDLRNVTRDGRCKSCEEQLIKG